MERGESEDSLPVLECMKNIENVFERNKLIHFWFDEVQCCMREDDFQRDFYESLQAQFYDKGTLSVKQTESLQRMYERVTRYES